MRSRGASMHIQPGLMLHPHGWSGVATAGNIHCNIWHIRHRLWSCRRNCCSMAWASQGTSTFVLFDPRLKSQIPSTMGSRSTLALVEFDSHIWMTIGVTQQVVDGPISLKHWLPNRGLKLERALRLQRPESRTHLQGGLPSDEVLDPKTKERQKPLPNVQGRNHLRFDISPLSDHGVQ